jgi:hypothetical protein
MSLLGGITNVLKGTVRGFASGGVGGALMGGVGSVFSGNRNPAKTKNTGIDPRRNVTKGKFQMSPTASPVPMTTLPDSGTFSAAPSIRQAPTPSTAVIPVSTNTGVLRPQVIPADTFMGFAPGGSTFGGAGAQAVMPMGSMAAMYRRYYNKNGTPRRIKANGQPYAVPRMNPMNPRAARRAIRRIRGARKLLQRIERSLPRARAAAPRRRAS